MDTSDEWIQKRTGIKARYWAADEESTMNLGHHASLMAIENSDIKKEDIDCIICASISWDAEFPGTGHFIQRELGISYVPVFDVKQQCSGFVYSMVMADNFIKTGMYKNILIIGAELQSKGLNKSDEGRDTAVLFGDGAGAIILSATTDSEGSRFLATDLHSDGRFAEELWTPAPGSVGKERISQEKLDHGLHYPRMNGKAVFIHAIKNMSQTILTSLEKANLAIEDIDLFLFHQANLRINSKISETLQIEDDKVFNTIQDYGNTTAATIPLGLYDAIEAGKVKKGDKIAFAAFGSGFTWGSVILQY